MTAADPDVELIARAIAATAPGGPATWRLYMVEAQATRDVLGTRLAPVSDRWQYGVRVDVPHPGRRERAGEVITHFPLENALRAPEYWSGWTLVRRRPAGRPGPWEEVGLDPDVLEDIADEEAPACSS